MRILADIGGTYARFARAEGRDIVEFKKYKAADYPSLLQALNAYCGETGLQGTGEIAIATAAYEDGQVWRFVNLNSWVIDPQMLENAGWTVRIILNDFAAATWGLLNLSDSGKELLKAGTGTAPLPRCLIGPGTGLGLGYLLPVKTGYHVQRTHGGHMIAAALTKEQGAVLEALKRLKTDNTVPVFENVVSGPGLYNIYRALCLINGQEPEFPDTPSLMKAHKSAGRRETVRLFHEFFGLFAQTVTVSGHAYGGLYLTGGVLDRLMESGDFDIEHFERFFVLPTVRSVHEALSRTPVIYIREPYLAMKGLINSLHA